MMKIQKSDFVEYCWFLKGINMGPFYFGCRIFHSIGTMAGVEFKWQEAIGILGFYHTHPYGFDDLSNEDITTMNAWVKAEGRSLLCGINSGNKKTCWRFFRQNDRIIYNRVKFLFLGPFFIGFQHKDDHEKRDERQEAY